MKKRLLLSFCVIAFLLPVPVTLAQQKDFQFWPSAGINLDLPKKFKVFAEEEIRLKENSTQIGRQINNLGVGYRINKYLRVAIYYRLEAKWDPDNPVWRQGLYGDLSLRHQIGNFEIDYRSRIQSSKVELNREEDRFTNRITHRHKLGCSYDISGLPLDVSAEGEMFYRATEGYHFSEYRIRGGLAWKPGKTHEFELKYGIVREVQVKDPLTAFVVSLGYTINIKL